MILLFQIQSSQSCAIQQEFPALSDSLLHTFMSELSAVFPGVSVTQLTDNSIDIQRRYFPTLLHSVSAVQNELQRKTTCSSSVGKIKFYGMRLAVKDEFDINGKNSGNASPTNNLPREKEITDGTILNRDYFQLFSSDTTPSFSLLHTLLPYLLPLPKHVIVEKKCQYPLSLDNPVLKTVPLYQKYSWLDIDSDSDIESKPSAELSSKEMKNSESVLSELKSFRMEEDASEDQTKVVESENARKKSDRKSRKHDSTRSDRSVCLATLDHIAEMMGNFSDLDILSTSQCLPGGADVFMPSTMAEHHYSNMDDIVQNLGRESCANKLNFLASSQCQKQKYSLLPSLLDQHSLASHDSASSLQRNIIERLSHHSTVYHQHQLEVRVMECSVNVGSEESHESLSVPEVAFGPNIQDLSETMNINEKIITCLPLLHRLTFSPDLVAMIRTLTRQDAINMAVSLLKRKRRRVVAVRGGGALLSHAGVEGLTQLQLNAIANALSDPL